MKKNVLLNSALSEVIARLGHGDMLAVLAAVTSEMQVESAVVASELAERNPALLAGMQGHVGSAPIETMSHDAFKLTTARAVAMVRTGECTPYANIILRAGVVF